MGGAGAAIRRVGGVLRESPVTIPSLAIVALFGVWTVEQGGYSVTAWSPGAIAALALLVISVAAVPLRISSIPRAVLLALASLAALTALSYLSILWADVPGSAWEGANRTLLYLLVFAQFALWRRSGAAAMLVLLAWVLMTVGIATGVLLHLGGAASPAGFFSDGRLKYPLGYENSAAAAWMLAAWPALLLAARRAVPWLLRGLLAGGVVVLAELSLLSLSRGALFSAPIMLVLVFVLIPGRLRTFAVLVPVGAGIAAATPSVLRVGNDRVAGAVVGGTLHSAVSHVLIAGVAVAIVVALAAALDARAPAAAPVRGHLRSVTAAVAAVALAAVIAGGLAAAGNPVGRVEHAWNTFSSEKGYAANSSGGRLTSGFGSARHDFYRVALDQFAAHPLLGIGADNYREQYLAHGRSQETPRYPHSVELRTLSQLGIVGALILLALLLGGLLAAWRAMRGPEGLGRAVAAAAAAGFAYFLVHGSFDWFWETAGLGAPAFALLGLACAVLPGATHAPAPAGVPEGGDAAPAASATAATDRAAEAGRPERVGRGVRIALIALGCVAALAAAAAIAAPWLSQLEVREAARIWRVRPAAAYDRLQQAANLNPLSDEAQVIAASIALRYGELRRADQLFALALQRDPGDAYAVLERGAIASTQGRRAQARALLERAARLAPRDALTREALERVRAGGTISVAELNGAILDRARQLE